MLQVRVDGPGADTEQAPDRPVVVPGRDELQDATLAGGQQRRVREGMRSQPRRFAEQHGDGRGRTGQESTPSRQEYAGQP